MPTKSLVSPQLLRIMSSGALGSYSVRPVSWGATAGAQGSQMWTDVLKLSACVFLTLQLNLSRPIEEQGPLDVIIHKLTDVILEADQNDSQSLELVHRFQVSKGGDACLWGLGGLWGGGKARIGGRTVSFRAAASVEMAQPVASCDFLGKCSVMDQACT